MNDRRDYFLKTDRLGFDLWREEDLPLAMCLWGDERVTRFFDARGRLTEAQVRARLEREIANQRIHGVQYWPLFRLADESLVGCCGLRPYDLDRRIYEIGFHIRPDHWRTGCAFEAARAVMGHAFQVLGASALFAGHHPDNHASRHLLKKLGFRFTHIEYFAPTGLEHPSYRLTAGDHDRLQFR